ncbi:MAG: Ig-like domain-containing protein [Clostridia bacterium]|nr:Ig-like domain-containing protein [Clostridia bacterium]
MDIKNLMKITSIILIFLIVFSIIPVISYATDNSKSGFSFISDFIKKIGEIISLTIRTIFNPREKDNPEKLTISSTSKTIEVGDSFPLTANKVVTWSSSNSSVAEVDRKGNVKGNGAGKVDIIATTSAGETAKCVVNVETTTALGGVYSPNSDTSAKTVGTFKSNINNKTFKILRQTEIKGWTYLCNRASSACIASGYSSETTDNLITTMNTYASNYSYIPSAEESGNKYFGNYGLKITERKTNDSTSTTLLKNKLVSQLTNGGYALIHFNKGFKGDSGTVWSNSSNEHWVAIIGYDGSKVFVADSRSNSSNTTGWYPISEFTNNDKGTMDYAIFINEN